jgi:hypothetical protein
MKKLSTRSKKPAVTCRLNPIDWDLPIPCNQYNLPAQGMTYGLSIVDRSSSSRRLASSQASRVL